MPVFSITPYLDIRSFITDIPSHFVMQYAFSALLVAGLVFLFRMPRFLLIFVAIALALNAVQIWQVHRVAPQEIYTSGVKQHFKVLQINTYTENKNTQPFDALLEKERPDIIFMAEINRSFSDYFHARKGLYPYQAFGKKVAILSKFPLTLVAPEIQPEHLAYSVYVNDKTIALLTFHPPTPLRDIRTRDSMIDKASVWINSSSYRNIILSGDINASVYSPAFKRIISETAMTQLFETPFLIGTYPRWLPALFRIPIDHTLVRGDLTILKAYRGTLKGTDHLYTITILQ